MKELERLAIDIQNGDEAAFAKMYEILAPSILNHIYKITVDKEAIFKIVLNLGSLELQRTFLSMKLEKTKNTLNIEK